jgi:thioredoxin reductase
MTSQTPVEHVELVVIGGGPGGIAAALEARRAGVSVCVLEERPSLGGQIYKRFPEAFAVADDKRAGAEYRVGRPLIDALERSGADVRTNCLVWGMWDKRIAYVNDEATSGVIDASCVVLAPGARDRPVAFPGWTLPGVLTAGAAKSLVSNQLVLPGRRILMAGSGPLALAFSAQLLDLGANIIEVHEAAPSPRPRALMRLAASAEPTVLLEAARYRARLTRRRVPLHYSSIILRAEGESEVERVVVAAVDRDWRVLAGTERSIAVDTVLLGYGLETSTELSRLCGCEHRFEPGAGGWVTVRDAWMRTSQPGILAVGDGSTVAGSANALLEGRLAGIAAAHDLEHLATGDAHERAGPFRRRIRRIQRFRRALQELYPFGDGIYELTDPDTVICRCEEVTAREVERVLADGVDDPNIIRALTRAGMGRCQGRNCASHLAAMISRRTGLALDRIEPQTVRPPVKPVAIDAIAAEREQNERTISLDD